MQSNQLGKSQYHRQYSSTYKPILIFIKERNWFIEDIRFRRQTIKIDFKVLQQLIIKIEAIRNINQSLMLKPFQICHTHFSQALSVMSEIRIIAANCKSIHTNARNSEHG